MSLSIGIVGLPNVGKSTLFNALVKSARAEVRNFPFTTIDPNVGVVPVPDERLTKITKIENSQTTVPTTIEFFDIAGLIRGAHKGEGLGNKFLSHIREVDAICLVVRAFEKSDTIHVEGRVDPRRDIETLITELALADLQTLSKIKERLLSSSKSVDKEGEQARAALALIQKIEPFLNNNKLINLNDFDKKEQAIVKESLPLLLVKPILVVFNVDENDAGLNSEDIHEKYKLSDILSVDIPTIAISAKIESEIAALPESEKQEYLQTIGLKEPGLDRLAREAYKLLDLITFFTAGPNESRAWTIIKGDSAYDAAGKIHTDFQKKFIRAEVISYDDFIEQDGWRRSADAGKMRLEGRDYIVKDADVVFFRHG